MQFGAVSRSLRVPLVRRGNGQEITVHGDAQPATFRRAAPAALFQLIRSSRPTRVLGACTHRVLAERPDLRGPKIGSP